MKVVHLCTMDFGGAGKAAYRLHKGLQTIGVDSVMLVVSKKTDDNSVITVPSIGSIPVNDRWNHLFRQWKSALTDYSGRAEGFELFTHTFSDTNFELIRELQNADVVNLHWVAGMFDYEHVSAVLRGKIIVWTLHDMNPFTGGCHYSNGCEKYHGSCGSCPQLGSSFTEDLSRRIWLKKIESYGAIDLTVVTPSKWLGKCAQESSLFSKRTIQVIPYGFPLNVYKPLGREEIRSNLNFPNKSKVVLFGATSVFNERKGLKYLLKALDHLATSGKAQDLVLAVFGQNYQSVEITCGYPVVNLGPIATEEQMALLYNAADVFVLPSLEDNLPNTVVESLACGTPVAAFNIGGVPDMVEHEVTGFLAPVKDIAGLAEAICWCLYTAPADTRKNCRERAENGFTLESQAHSYKDIYKLAMAGALDNLPFENKYVANVREFINMKPSLNTIISSSDSTAYMSISDAKANYGLKLKIVVLDLSPIGGDTASGQMKNNIFTGLNENNLIQIYPLTRDLYRVEKGIDNKVHLYDIPGKEVPDLIKTISPDLIYHRPSDKPQKYFWLGYYCCTFLDIPYVLHFLDDWPSRLYLENKSFFASISNYLQMMVNNANGLLSISESMADEFKNRYGKDFVPLANGINSSEYTSGRKLLTKDRSFIFRYTGSIAVDMNFQSLLDFAEVIQIVSTTIPVALEIYTNEKCMKLAKEIEANTGASAHSLVPRCEYPDLLVSADALLLPFNFDELSIRYLLLSQANKLPEYIMSGTPIFTYGPDEINTIKEIRKGKYGVIVSERDKDKLHENVLNLISNYDHYLETSLRSKVYAEQQYDVSTIRDDFRSFLMSAADQSVRQNKLKVTVNCATVREYNKFLEMYHHVTHLSGDLKNFQRPWVIDSVLKQAPRGGRVLEIGADKCELAEFLQQLGYEVWVIDIFDEFGGGVAKFEEVKNRFPNIHFTRGFIHEDKTLPANYFDAIYSCSVIEHNPVSVIPATFDRIHQCLKAGGKSIHAIDFTVDGAVLKNHGFINAVLSWHGLLKTAEEIGNEALDDVDTFYLSPQGHYNWRKFLGKTYDEYPFRKVTSLNIISTK